MSKIPFIDSEKCVGCGQCYEVCPGNAVDFLGDDELFEKARHIVREYLRIRDMHMAEYARLEKEECR